MFTASFVVAQQNIPEVGVPVQAVDSTVSRDVHADVPERDVLERRDVPSEARAQPRATSASKWGPARNTPVSAHSVGNDLSPSGRTTNTWSPHIEDANSKQTVSDGRSGPDLQAQPHAGLNKGMKSGNKELIRSEPEQRSAFESSRSFSEKSASLLEKKTTIAPFSFTNHASLNARKKISKTSSASLATNLRRKPFSLDRSIVGTHRKVATSGEIAKYSGSRSTRRPLQSKAVAGEFSE